MGRGDVAHLHLARELPHGRGAQKGGVERHIQDHDDAGPPEQRRRANRNRGIMLVALGSVLFCGIVSLMPATNVEPKSMILAVPVRSIITLAGLRS